MNYKVSVRVVFFILVYCLLSSSLAQAATPTAEELCIQRNSASCEINGLRFFIQEEDCPRGAKVLRPHGNERCDNIAGEIKVAGKSAVEVPVKPASSKVAEVAPVAPENNTAAGWLETPLIIAAVIGLLQGLVSRLGWGPFVIVALVMPVILTWGIISSVSTHMAGAEYWGHLALEFVKIFAGSMLGWGAGLAIHMGLLKLLYK